jgi:hypothetical protein
MKTDRPKCDFVHCVAGGGVARHGRCFLRGNPDWEHCPNFMTEEDFTAGRIPVSRMGAVVGHISAKTFKAMYGIELKDVKPKDE